MKKIDKDKIKAFLKKIETTLCGETVYVTEWTSGKRAEYEAFVRSYKGQPIDPNEHRQLIFKLSVVDGNDVPFEYDTDYPFLEIDRIEDIATGLNVYTEKVREALKKGLTQTDGTTSQPA